MKYREIAIEMLKLMGQELDRPGRRVDSEHGGH